MPDAEAKAPGRLPVGPPVAVIDIGSNSVRLVVYEGIARSPTPIFNEKTLCGLGREVQTTGRLPQDAVEKAYASLKRFRALCETIRVAQVFVLATAAARDAENGRDFIAEVERITGVEVELLSGKREAKLSALGVISGTHDPDGVVGDLGGGSLELIDINGHKTSAGATYPLGGLALQDLSERSMRKAEKIVKNALGKSDALEGLSGRTFYAVGGTWRSLAKLHMFQRGYPLHVMHGYAIPAREALDFTRMVQSSDQGMISKIEVVSDARRPLLAWGALVLEHVLRVGKPSEVVISALGVREGLLFSMLDEEERKQDPLLTAARDLGRLRSRSPQHGEDLIRWTDAFADAVKLDETKEERRLRHAACLVADVGWRAHPDYRGEQSLNILANAAFVGIDHPGRAFLALTIFYRYMGLVDDELSPRLRELAPIRLMERARILGAAMRVAYLVSAATEGVLDKAHPEIIDGKLVLPLRGDLAALAGDRLLSRLKTLGRLVGREAAIVTNGHLPA